MPHIAYPTTPVPGMPPRNVFHVLDDAGLKYGSASVVEFYNDTLVPDRPLNYYVNISAMDERAFDMLLGAVMARSFDLHQMQQHLRARIYVPCKPDDRALLHNLETFGFINDDADIRMRKVIESMPDAPKPPVGCFITPVILETEGDYAGLLQRVNQYSLMTRSQQWLQRLANEQKFVVFGAWQDPGELLGELVLTAYGSEGRVEMIYTRPEYRDRGVATALIAHASNALAEENIHILNAEVWCRNRNAMKLFSRNRFEEAGPLMLYPGINL